MSIFTANHKLLNLRILLTEFPKAIKKAQRSLPFLWLLCAFMSQSICTGTVLFFKVYVSIDLENAYNHSYFILKFLPSSISLSLPYLHIGE